MKKIYIVFFSILISVLVFAAVSSGQSTVSLNFFDKQEDKNQQENDRPLKIKNKPTARTGNCSQSSGQITVRATFDKSATVTAVDIVESSGCSSFDQNAVDAAKGIKFDPAIKNGQPVTITKLLKYTFTRF